MPTPRESTQNSPLHQDQKVTKGLYLVEPHGRLIYTGKKTAIVKARQFDLEGNWVIISKEHKQGLAFGKARVGPVEHVLIDDFDARFDEHRVTTRERKGWWPNATKLFLWPIESFEPYDEPRHVDVPAGVQTIMETVEFTPTGEPGPAKEPGQDRARPQTEEGRPRETDDAPDTDGAKASKADEVDEEANVPYSSMSEINPSLRGIKPPITLAQANLIAGWADSIEEKPDGPKSPWAVAIAQFKRLYTVQSGRWVKKQASKARGEGQGGADATVMDENGDEHLVLTAHANWATLADKARGEGQGVDGPRQGDAGAATCVCPECGAEVEHERGTPCNEVECPKCGTAMEGKPTTDAEDANGSKAKWTVAYMNNLPDSAFLLVEAGKKDDEGKTVPRSLRHLPYKDASGKVDLDHVRNAISRAPRIKLKDGSRISPEKAAALQKKARAILAKQGKKSLEEVLAILSALDEDEKAANLADWLEANLHQQFTIIADSLFADGCLAREERLALSGAIGDALDVFHTALEGEELIALGERAPYAQAESTPVGESPSLARSLKETLKEGFGSIVENIKAALAPKSVPSPMAFKTFEAHDGHTWLILSAVNAFRDHDIPPEIFATKAIEDFVARHEDDDEKGEFWFWHIPGAKFADIKWQGMSGRFLFEAGPFDDTKVGRAFKQFFTQYPHGHPAIAPRGWGASHGYDYVAADRKDGIYDWFEKRESSVLPHELAANPYNPEMEVLQMNDKQAEALRAIGGDDLVTLITETGEARTQELEKHNVAFKEKGEGEPDEAEPKDAAESEPNPAESTEPPESTEVDTDAKVVASVVKALQLDELSKMLKSQTEVLATLAEQSGSLTKRLEVLERDDEQKLAEKQLEVPRYSWFRASQAAETVLTAQDQLHTARPHVPAPIAQLSGSE